MLALSIISHLSGRTGHWTETAVYQQLAWVSLIQFESMNNNCPHSTLSINQTFILAWIYLESISLAAKFPGFAELDHFIYMHIYLPLEMRFTNSSASQMKKSLSTEIRSEHSGAQLTCLWQARLFLQIAHFSWLTYLSQGWCYT